MVARIAIALLKVIGGLGISKGGPMFATPGTQLGAVEIARGGGVYRYGLAVIGLGIGPIEQPLCKPCPVGEARRIIRLVGHALIKQRAQLGDSRGRARTGHIVPAFGIAAGQRDMDRFGHGLIHSLVRGAGGVGADFGAALVRDYVIDHFAARNADLALPCDRRQAQADRLDAGEGNALAAIGQMGDDMGMGGPWLVDQPRDRPPAGPVTRGVIINLEFGRDGDGVVAVAVSPIRIGRAIDGQRPDGILRVILGVWLVDRGAAGP